MNDLESRLRTTLSEHADNAPRGGPLAERILAELDAPAPVLRPRGGWRTWTMPLLAAAAVAAVVASVVGIDHLHTTASPKPPATSHLPSIVSSPQPTPTAHKSPAPHSSPTRVVPPPDPGGVTGFRVTDLSFISDPQGTRGWALGSADCKGTGRCTAMFETSDGKTWTSVPGVAFRVPGVENCADPCVDHIRFANDKVGYAYSSTALFMTLDGGADWTAQTGGADALETLSNNVIRVVSDGSGCPGPCNIRIETAEIGSPKWQTVLLDKRKVSGVSVQFTRAGTDAYVLVQQDPAGGAPSALSTLYTSTDNGASWTPEGEPCPQAGGEVDSTAVAAGPKEIGVLCLPRGAQQGEVRAFVAVAAAGGTPFTRAGGLVPVASANGPIFVGDPATELIVAGTNTYRSTDGGAHWRQLPQISSASWIGFESPTDGRAVTDGGRTIWTTHDGGQSWTPYRFG